MVVLSDNTPSAVLSDQVKSLDWRRRRASHMGEVTPNELATVRAKIGLLIGIVQTNLAI